jgi:peptide/nickel transport system permease protein
MTRYLARRLLQAVPLMLVISMLSFGLLHLAPGDPAALVYGGEVPANELAKVREAWGLDQPIHIQYLRWLGNVVRGDFGRSYADGRPAAALVWDRVPATLLLTLTALALALALGVGIGAWSGARPRGIVDRVAVVLATVGYSTPNFWLALLLILLFAVWLGWLPSAGMESARGESTWLDRLRYLVLPASVLAVREAAALLRFTRAAVRDAIAADYVRTARAKGLTELVVVIRHALRNALLPVITLLGLFTPRLLSGSVVVETVFAWPGLGRLAIEASLRRDYSVLMGEIMLVGAFVVIGSLLADIGYAAADPRIRYGGESR